jgi:hypothetical protein
LAVGVDGEGRRVRRPEALTDDESAHLAVDELRLAAVGNPTVCTYLFQMIAGSQRPSTLTPPASAATRASSIRPNFCSTTPATAS